MIKNLATKRYIYTEATTQWGGHGTGATSQLQAPVTPVTGRGEHVHVARAHPRCVLLAIGQAKVQTN